MRKVIFDTDPGVDDAMALAFLTLRPELDLIGVTTVLGNADIETVTRNALFLKDRLGFAAPVAQGSGVTLLGKHGDYPRHVHGENGLGDIAIPEEITSRVDGRRAHRMMIDLIRSNPGEVTIIAVGRMTNLARALDKDPEIARLVQGVIVMGGAFGTHGHTGNVSPVAEANIAGDPDAADAVFTAHWPVTIVGLDVTQEVVLDAALLERLRDKGGERGRLLYEVSHNYHGFHQRSRKLDGIFAHDTLAVAYAVDPTLFTTREGAVRVICGGLASGQTIQKPERSSFPTTAWDPHPSQSVCIGVDTARMTALIESSFIPQPGVHQVSGTV